MSASPHRPGPAGTPIRISAALILDALGRVLLVRKRGTRCFMQPGGKIHDRETPLEALARELAEELGCRLVGAELLGTFTAAAANEPRRSVEAALFLTEVAGEIEPAAEIQEVAWVEPGSTGALPLAPLTRDRVLPLALSRAGRRHGP